MLCIVSFLFHPGHVKPMIVHISFAGLYTRKSSLRKIKKQLCTRNQHSPKTTKTTKHLVYTESVNVSVKNEKVAFNINDLGKWYCGPWREGRVCVSNYIYKIIIQLYYIFSSISPLITCVYLYRWKDRMVEWKR